MVYKFNASTFVVLNGIKISVLYIAAVTYSEQALWVVYLVLVTLVQFTMIMFHDIFSWYAAICPPMRSLRTSMMSYHVIDCYRQPINNLFKKEIQI